MKKDCVKVFSSILFMTIILILFAVPSNAQCDHVWGPWQVYVEPTCDSKGSSERHCEKCYQIESKEIPVKAHSWSPWKMERVPTPYAEGYNIRYCFNCSKEQKQYLPKVKMTINQKKAISVVNTYMKAAKKYDIKKMNRCFASKPKKYGYPTKNLNNIFKRNNKKAIKWEITNITGNNKKYVVTVKITQPNYYNKIYDIYYDALEYALLNNQSGTKAGTSAINKMVKKLKNAKIKKSTETYRFPIIKKNGKWKIEKKNRTIVDIACGYLNVAMNDATDQFLEDYAY